MSRPARPRRPRRLRHRVLFNQGVTALGIAFALLFGVIGVCTALQDLLPEGMLILIALGGLLCGGFIGCAGGVCLAGGLLGGAVHHLLRLVRGSPTQAPVLKIHVSAPRRGRHDRCPFCLVGLNDPSAAHLARTVCHQCQARQHVACSYEARGRCSACFAPLHRTLAA